MNCAALLERMGGGYKLDERESSRHNLKYRRGAGEIIIINHDGKGWWDPGSNAKGDVFSLAQHLDPSLNFGRVRGVLRHMLGVAPLVSGGREAQEEAEPASGRALAEPPCNLQGLAHMGVSDRRAAPAGRSGDRRRQGGCGA